MIIYSRPKCYHTDVISFATYGVKATPEHYCTYMLSPVVEARQQPSFILYRLCHALYCTAMACTNLSLMRCKELGWAALRGAHYTAAGRGALCMLQHTVHQDRRSSVDDVWRKAVITPCRQCYFCFNSR